MLEDGNIFYESSSYSHALLKGCKLTPKANTSPQVQKVTVQQAKASIKRAKEKLQGQDTSLDQANASSECKTINVNNTPVDKSSVPRRITYDGYIYRLNSVKGQRARYRCLLNKSSKVRGCRAELYTDLTGCGKVKRGSREHDHKPDVNLVADVSQKKDVVEFPSEQMEDDANEYVLGDDLEVEIE